MLDTTSLLRLAAVSNRAFLFFDELGAATVVDEGEAIATAILEHTRSAGHSCIASTHFQHLASLPTIRALRIHDGYQLGEGMDVSDGLQTAQFVHFCPDVLSLT